jgi:hypothetical protein
MIIIDMIFVKRVHLGGIFEMSLLPLQGYRESGIYVNKARRLKLGKI